jgi:hypothetical protein
MREPLVSLEGIAHDGNLEVPMTEWQHIMELARGFGWKLANERLWQHFYSPIREPEPMPAADARSMGDALEAALVLRCSHQQFPPDPRNSTALLRWRDSLSGRAVIRDIIVFLWMGGFFASYEEV